VPGIDLYSIGPNDFAQSLGQPDHPEVVKVMQEITRRIRHSSAILHDCRYRLLGLHGVHV
jgi:2-keto-3-deoxy-L-rhamnonate aldolase RhmA